MLKTSDQPVTITTIKHANAKVMSPSTTIRARGLGKEIDDWRILLNLNFEIPRGAYGAILGANGAGKSTLLKILATLLPASTGQLELFSMPVRNNTIRLRSNIGLIGHNSMLYRDLSARENLIFFARLYDHAAPVQRVDELLQYVELHRSADDPVKTLSRGMLQRIAIARALVHDPDLLLADEPFTGLDAPSCKLLQELLSHQHAEGKTIMLVNHDIRQSRELAERIIVLRKGKIIIDEPSVNLEVKSILEGIST